MAAVGVVSAIAFAFAIATAATTTIATVATAAIFVVVVGSGGCGGGGFAAAVASLKEASPAAAGYAHSNCPRRTLLLNETHWCEETVGTSCPRRLSA